MSYEDGVDKLIRCLERHEKLILLKAPQVMIDHHLEMIKILTIKLTTQGDLEAITQKGHTYGTSA